ncbi:MAG: xylulokinase [Clostridia bacterium]|nr:xylulokinase [Clostridia bacterium]
MVLMGIDIGTSGAKCVVINSAGSVLAKSTHHYPLETPRPGWAEQDPEWWIEAAYESIREVLASPAICPEQIAGISFSGQMHGLVPLDSAGQVIRKSILWCDQRTQKQCDTIEDTAGGRDALLRMTNNVMLTGYTGGKILWLREKEPAHFEAMSIFLCPKDYLRYRLTGVPAMDVSEASGTGLFDTRNRTWCWDLIDRLNLSRSLFPQTLESTEPAGAITSEAAAATGLLEGTPCFAGGGDAVVQSFGSGLIREGTVGAVIGTAGNVSMGFEEYRVNPGGKLQMFCGVTPGSYMSFGATQTAGGALSWFRDQLSRDILLQAQSSGENSFDLMGRLALASPPGSGGVVFAPYLSGERCPYPDPSARGVLYGLSLNTQQSDMIRAVMEGIVYSLRQIVDIYRSFADVSSAVASGGGASSDLFLQMQAGIFEMPVRTVSAASEGGAYGAALIAGLGLGWFQNAQDAVALLHTEKKVQPDTKDIPLYRKSYEIYRRVYPALKDIYQLGSKLYEEEEG